MRQFVGFSLLVLVLSGCAANTLSLQDLMREASENRLALVGTRGLNAVVIPFDGPPRYYAATVEDLAPIKLNCEGFGNIQHAMRDPSFPRLIDIKAVDRACKHLAFFSSRGTGPASARPVELRWRSVFGSGDDTLVTTIFQPYEFGDEMGWSIDGRVLVYEKQGQIWSYDTETRSSTALVRGQDPTWSPDGHQIAFRGADGCMLMSPDGQLRSWALKGHKSGGPIRWSPDGDYVSFSEYNPTHLPVIGAYHLLRVCRLSDGACATAREFGLDHPDINGFYWIRDYRTFCSLCKPGQPFN